MGNLQSNSYYRQLYCNWFCRRLQCESYYKRLHYDSSICFIYLFTVLPHTFHSGNWFVWRYDLLYNVKIYIVVPTIESYIAIPSAECHNAILTTYKWFIMHLFALFICCLMLYLVNYTQRFPLYIFYLRFFFIHCIHRFALWYSIICFIM